MRHAVLLLVALSFTQAAVPRFELVQPELFAAGGAFTNAWADFDGDGDLDLFVGFGGAPNRLYRQDKGTFTDVAAEVGVADARATRATAWGDFDRDGDPDLLVGFTPGAQSLLKVYRNDKAKFVDVTEQTGLAVSTGAVRQPSWIDFDGDGDLDLFVAFRDRPNAMFTNDGGKFTDVATAVGLADPRRTVGAVWFDYDEDGDLDVYVGNMDGDANGLFRNDKGKFVDVAEEAGVAWGGRAPKDTAQGTVRPCAGDFDNDGHLDLFMANYGTNGLFLYRGKGRFEDVSAAWGLTFDGRHDTCALADVDNDGRLDVYVNGTVTGGVSYRDYLLRNTGSRFEDATPPNIGSPNASHGAQWADFDADGDVDLTIGGSRADATHALLRSAQPDADRVRSIAIRVVDAKGHATRAGLVMRIFSVSPRRLVATRLVDSGSGYASQNDMPVHVGLPSTDSVAIEYSWPGGQLAMKGGRTPIDPRRWAGRVLVLTVGR